MSKPLTWTDDDVRRFFSHTERLRSGCLFWAGARSRGKGNKKWYGTFYVSGKNGKRGRRVRAHRFAALIAGHRELDPGEHRDHTCCFSLCVEAGPPGDRDQGGQPATQDS